MDKSQRDALRAYLADLEASRRTTNHDRRKRWSITEDDFLPSPATVTPFADQHATVDQNDG